MYISLDIEPFLYELYEHLYIDFVIQFYNLILTQPVLFIKSFLDS